MTLVEFFDKNAAENVCACLAARPEKIILLGDKRKTLLKHSARYGKILEKRGHRAEFVCKSINNNNLSTIVSVLSEIVEDNQDCVLDLTGGDDLFLTAAGIVSERYADKKIQLTRFNIRSGVMYDCDNDGINISSEGVFLSVEENICIYGGDVIGKPTFLSEELLDSDVKKDIIDIWDICRTNVKHWNFTVNTGKFSDKIGERLKKKGLIFEEGGKVKFKNEYVRRCLSKAGAALETVVFLAALEASDEDGAPSYNDAMNGVSIDWDGISDEDKSNTINEIDVMLMHGMIPVFISCKNGAVDTEELYKLNTVAQRFGGRYGKKVLVASSLAGKGEFGEHFRQRASDMNIRIIDNICDISFEQITNTVKNFWKN